MRGLLHEKTASSRKRTKRPYIQRDAKRCSCCAATAASSRHC